MNFRNYEQWPLVHIYCSVGNCFLFLIVSISISTVYLPQWKGSIFKLLFWRFSHLGTTGTNGALIPAAVPCSFGKNLVNPWEKCSLTVHAGKKKKKKYKYSKIFNLLAACVIKAGNVNSMHIKGVLFQFFLNK